MLADYLATEQAREDVRDLLHGDKPRLPIMGSDDLCLVRDEVGAWRTVMLWDDAQNKELTAYYRPDGDRYIVTDLGEGWRQHRIRTGRVDWTSAVIADCDYNPHIVDSGETATAGDCEKVILNSADLPDAICRVMLASLRVAGVQS